MKNRYFFLFAPVTSGSTFLTKILNSFENTLGIPDALFEFFKFIIQKTNKKKISNNTKIETVYFSKNCNNYLQNCKNINLNKKVKKKDLKVIKDRIIHNSYFTPEFSNKLKSLSGKNYKIVFFNLIKKLKKIYGNKKTINICLKHAWIEDISLSILKYFNNSRLIFLIRDPRDAILSQYKKNVFDILMLSRHHRKHIAYALLLKKKYKDRVMIVKYEDLILNNKIILKELSNFLNKKISKKSISQIKWNFDAVNNWKKKPKKSKYIKLINQLLNFELKYLGYENEINEIDDNEFRLLFKDCLKSLNKKYDLNKEIKNENYRKFLFFNKLPKNKKIINNYFLFKEVYNILKYKNLCK